MQSGKKVVFRIKIRSIALNKDYFVSYVRKSEPVIRRIADRMKAAIIPVFTGCICVLRCQNIF